LGYRLLSVNSVTPTGCRSLEGDVALGSLGLESDAQLRYDPHAEISKALYAYPREHYAIWQTMRAQAQVASWDDSLPYGSLGESLTLEGLVESDLWIGDVLRLPRCQLAVSAPGVAGEALNTRMGFPQASRMMIQSGWCGFYLAVREAGWLAAGETFSVVPGPRHISVRELFDTATGRYLRRR
jgi:MOSC domain-containing protein YiiM